MLKKLFADPAFQASVRTAMSSGVLLSFLPFAKVFTGERTLADAAAIWVVLLPVVVVSMTLLSYGIRKAFFADRYR